MNYLFFERLLAILYMIRASNASNTTTAQYLVNFTTYKTNLCTTVTNDAIQNLSNQIDNLIQLETSGFGFDLNIIKILSSNISDLVKKIPILIWVGAVFIVIIIVAMVIQLLVGIINLCYCNKKADERKHANCSFTMMIIFFILYTVVFVLVVIYTSIVLK